MQAIYDNGSREFLRDIPQQDVPSVFARMLADGAREITVRPEPWEESGVAARVIEQKEEERERRVWEQRRKRKGVMVGGKKR